jgi:hypothetical protein
MTQTDPYTNYCEWANRPRQKAERETCECGKIVYASQKEKHMSTKLHERLMTKKVKYVEPTKKIKFTEDQQDEIKRMFSDFLLSVNDTV